MPVADGLATRIADKDYLVGLVLVAALPAAFWVGAIKLAAVALGLALTWTTALIVGGCIATFLASTYMLLIRRR